MIRSCRWPLIAWALLASSLGRAQEPSAAAPAPQKPADYFSQRLAALDGELAGKLTGPRAAATLYELALIEPDLDSLAPLARTLARVANDRRALPQVRALARWLLVRADVERARLPAAKSDLAALGFLTDGWVVGGFDNEGGNGHDAIYPPEAGPIDLKASYPGKARPVSWRRLPPLAPDGEVPLADVVRPRANETTYFATTLVSPVAQRALLSLGGSGQSKLWVNGQLVFVDPDDHPARFDQHAVGVGLRRGANVVLFKLSTLAQTPAFFLRATSPSGRLLPGVKVVAPAPGTPLLPPPSAPGRGDTRRRDKVVPVVDLADQLATLVEDHPNDGALRADYALVLDGRQSFDSKTRLARHQQQKAAELLATDPRAWLRLASWIDDDHNERRQALEKALAVDPNFAPARTGLGLYEQALGFPQRAFAELTRAVAENPGYAPAGAALTDALEALGLQGKANALALALADEFPTTPETVLGAAQVDESLGRLKEAMARYQVALALRWDDEPARRALASLQLQTGDVEGAAATLKTALELHPTAIQTGLRLAHLYSANGKAAKALALYDELARLAPDDDQLFEARGRHELKVGAGAKARADFDRALQLKPQNPALRELLRDLQPQEEYAQPYLQDPVKLAASEKGRAAGPDDDAIVLANVDVVRVYPNGLSSRVHQEIVRIVNDRGVDRERLQALAYTPGEQEVKVLHARIVKPDGTVVEAKSESDRRLTDSWAGEYFDRQQRLVLYPNLEPGDVLEWTYRLDDVSQENMFADYFGDVSYLQGADARRRVDYVLIAPKGRTFYTNSPALKGLAHSVTSAGDTSVWRWEVKDVPKLDPEPNMPGWANVAAYLHVSTFKDWNDVARFWWGMVHDQLQVTPAVAKAADDAVKGIPASDVAGRVRAVYDFVVTQTRYVGLEFGIHGFKPYSVDRILARRFGDCKDKASLMDAMLHHLGIPAKLVLLRMHQLGQLAPQPASLAVFNHAILYVPALHRFLDGTAEFSGSEELPGADQGAQVLVVDPDPSKPSRFYTTPYTTPDDNVTSTVATIALAADGSARLTGRSRVTGQNAQGYRRYYEAEADRRQRFEQGYSRSYPGAKAVTFTLTDPKKIESPVDTSFVLDVPSLAHPEDGALLFSPFGQPSRYLQALAPLSKRTWPVDLGAPWKNAFDYTVTWPKELVLAGQPTTLEKTTPFGSYRYETKVVPGGLEVKGYLALSATSIPPAQYAEFRAFLGDLDRTLSHRLRLVPTPGRAEAKR